MLHHGGFVICFSSTRPPSWAENFVFLSLVTPVWGNEPALRGLCMRVSSSRLLNLFLNSFRFILSVFSFFRIIFFGYRSFFSWPIRLVAMFYKRLSDFNAVHLSPSSDLCFYRQQAHFLLSFNAISFYDITNIRCSSNVRILSYVTIGFHVTKMWILTVYDVNFSQFFVWQLFYQNWLKITLRTINTSGKTCHFSLVRKNDWTNSEK